MGKSVNCGFRLGRPRDQGSGLRLQRNPRFGSGVGKKEREWTPSEG